MATTWKVTKQDPVTLTGANRGERGVRVTFQTSTGLTDYVEVPNTDYPAGVRAAIDARVAQHDAVAGMSSDQGAGG